MTLSRATSSENYDATNLLLAEMARIRLHLGINQLRTARPERSIDKGPNDAFALIHLINRNLGCAHRSRSRADSEIPRRVPGGPSTKNGGMQNAIENDLAYHCGRLRCSSVQWRRLGSRTIAGTLPGWRHRPRWSCS